MVKIFRLRILSAYHKYGIKDENLKSSVNWINHEITPLKSLKNGNDYR